MNEMTNQTVLITGAKGGLGSFVTEAFLAVGATVIGSSKSIQDSDFANPRFAAMPADLTDGAASRQLAKGVISRFQKIDVVVHVMGGFAGGQPIAETDDATWEKMIDLNLRSAVNLLRAVLPHMREAKRGRIIAIAGRMAVDPQPNLSAYSASKAALVSLLRTAALENRDLGITANTVLPGTMITEANRKADPGADTSKWVPPQDVASLILFLASDAGAQITGAAIPVYARECSLVGRTDCGIGGVCHGRRRVRAGLREPAGKRAGHSKWARSQASRNSSSLRHVAVDRGER